MQDFFQLICYGSSCCSTVVVYYVSKGSVQLVCFAVQCSSTQYTPRTWLCMLPCQVHVLVFHVCVSGSLAAPVIALFVVCIAQGSRQHTVVLDPCLLPKLARAVEP